MYLVLTDLLSCPRCGPEQGLIVLAERMAGRRILEGSLGCPNCESHFRISGGLADLRPGQSVVAISPELQAAPAVAERGAAVDPMRIAALLGIVQGPAFALLLGKAAADARAVAELIPGLELIAVGPEVGTEEAPGVSRLLVEADLPLHSGSLRAALVGTGVLERTARDAVRTLTIGARLVVSTEHAWVDELVASGVLRVLARDSLHVVTIRVG